MRENWSLYHVLSHEIVLSEGSFSSSGPSSTAAKSSLPPQVQSGGSSAGGGDGFDLDAEQCGKSKGGRGGGRRYYGKAGKGGEGGGARKQAGPEASRGGKKRPMLAGKKMIDERTKDGKVHKLELNTKSMRELAADAAKKRMEAAQKETRRKNAAEIIVIDDEDEEEQDQGQENEKGKGGGKEEDFEENDEDEDEDSGEEFVMPEHKLACICRSCAYDKELFSL